MAKISQRFFLFIGLMLILAGMISLPWLLDVFSLMPATELSPLPSVPQNSPGRLPDAPSPATPAVALPQWTFPLPESEESDTAFIPDLPAATQTEQEAQAYRESLQSVDTADAESGLTEAEIFTLEHQHVLREQAAQEAAAYRESLQSTQTPADNAGFTEFEMMQMEQQKLGMEQARKEAADYEKSLQSTSLH